MAATLAVRVHETETAVTQLKYSRAALQLQVTPNEASSNAELSAYYEVINQLIGTDLNPEKIRQQQLQRRLDRYERITGYKIGSPEFNAAVDRTAAVLEAYKYQT